ncbi:MAG: hypothetical protein A3C93_04655 [Candidatus Lloydbacteria bacterium RIFCSPHIGHO2_02_FULL_54_17]|uniref:Uncharacterized protein n=1 Tax=Candidatus Lloydbacteria bacterium RIFCSPHIGHO2_02_FULL_54_17 TaxID=1798664 RepID=A0A1G2DFY1_9BACT|nr:MAG: hypothetical protein A2762_01565 [Candidatus Lloydbacteria bacterium RIFCSPHIGHO2_01_FULL_54_11]OGZ12443.1 MAG: hypothetical protein A3C93_04655 [Candidatus Lloydbacteria bacterium RIFCSPHIGHO2_02_FULL_54_17]OGZ14702.1 MAG: hypothetical protein A2948_04335 [Candidatus Lloydbacteria bacterium RIFCSPLOWO2_01_FULL_54_18]OGZ16730.1 MAG: hypothetical protein A3H76_02240 [Candidatus Lloydbacteria bacterium RIFCSPLOWO2_02_FULL_54_12]
MILSLDKTELSRLNRDACIQAILERRRSIREHRDQKGDDRCFFDDYLVWQWLSGSPSEPKVVLPEKGMRECVLFYEHRRAEAADPAPEDAILESVHWDDDLPSKGLPELHAELLHIQEAIRLHRDIAKEKRSADDDRALYGVLPEKAPADFRLPPKEEFLGEARAPRAGCPTFWRSHADCGVQRHDYHKWGPCKESPA